MTRQNKFLNQHRNVLVEYYSERNLYEPDKAVVNILTRNMPMWVSDRLKENIKESLRGFSFDMAMEIVVCVNNCAQYGQCDFTCMPYVDRLLAHHYNAILHEADQKGVEIKNPEKEDFELLDR